MFLIVLTEIMEKSATSRLIFYQHFSTPRQQWIAIIRHWLIGISMGGSYGIVLASTELWGHNSLDRGSYP